MANDLIALVDCNSFYASCHQVFRPDLRGKPVIVLSNNDGCIVARSAEAKAIGIPNMAPYFQVKRLCEEAGVAVMSSNYPLFADLSARVTSALEEYSDVTEVYSIDESFIKLPSGSDDLKIVGHEIRHKVYRDTGIQVGVGIGPTKTLAKLANHVAKRHRQGNGVCILDEPDKWDWTLKRVAVDTIWGIGKRTAARLNHIGIFTGYDLATASTKLVSKHTNVVAAKTVEELNGVACFDLETTPEPRQQIVCSRSFPKKTDSYREVRQYVAEFASRVAEKLRQQDGKAIVLGLTVSSSRFRPGFIYRTQAKELRYPSNETDVIASEAGQLLEALWLPGHCINKAAVMAMEIIPASHEQLDLFERGQSEKQSTLWSCVDKINRRHGKHTLKAASCRRQSPNVSKVQFPSPCYTTRWADLPLVRA